MSQTDIRSADDEQPLQTTINIAQIQRGLRKIQLSTEHGRCAKANIIAHLQTYAQSIRATDAIDVGALGAAIAGMNWLSEHICQIDDKKVLPRKRMFIIDVAALCQAHYDTLRSL